MQKVIRSESDFESVYNPDDSMQSDEMSFFNNFKYEGDDQQDISRDDILHYVNKQNSAVKQYTSHQSATRLNDSKQSPYDDILRSHEDHGHLDNILSALQETEEVEDEEFKYDRQSILNETVNIEEGSIDTKKLNMAFLEAIQQNKKDRIQKILNPNINKGLLDVTFKNEQGMNSVLMCCLVNNLELLKKLVNEHNGNTSVINSVNKRVALHYACIQNNSEILAFLLSKNTSLKNFQDFNDCTPLFYASLNNSEKCVEMLLSCEANVHLKNKDQYSACEVTTNYNIYKMLEKKMNVTNGTPHYNTYNRTLIPGSNRLATNSRKDRVHKLINKCKSNHYYFQERHTSNEDQQAGSVNIHQYQKPVLINGRYYDQFMLQREKAITNQFKKFLSETKKFIQIQKECDEKCRIYLEKVQKMNAPIKLRRKVTIEDFIFYRMIGEGSFGEVYLVKIKENVVKHTQESKQNSEPSVIDKIKNDLHNRVKQFDTKSPDESTNNIEGRTIESGIMSRDVTRVEYVEVDKIEENNAHIQRLQHLLNKNNDEQDDPSKKFYALKIIRKEALKKKKLASYIEFEKSVMQEIQNPFIAKLHLTFQNDTHLFLLMDFYQGGDLGRILEKDVEVDEFQVKVWAAQIVLALEELHKKDIIYRDLKPENVVLDAKGNLHLIDFGLAKRGVNAITSSFCGTPIYLPPEIVGRSGHNKMVDWYSLGVIIYELLIGRPPYFSSDCKQLFNDIQTQPLRLPKSLPEDSKGILIQLLRKNYKTRLGYERDAEEIKEHPWFAEIDWENVQQKRYSCLKPMLLNIPTQPIDFKLKPSEKSCNIQLEHKWSYYNIDDTPTPKYDHTNGIEQ